MLHLPSSFRRFLRNVSFRVYTHCHAHTNPQITNVADRVNICVRTTVYMNMCVKKEKLNRCLIWWNREHWSKVSRYATFVTKYRIISLWNVVFTMLSPCLPFKKARWALRFSFYVELGHDVRLYRKRQSFAFKSNSTIYKKGLIHSREGEGKV